MRTYADQKFIETCAKIINEGTESPCRAVWENEDGTTTKANTKHIFGVTNEYDLSDGNQFPLLTLRKTNWKNAVDEILWIWQKHSNDVNELNSHIWDSWADENGLIGKAYGYQLSKLYGYKIGNEIRYMNQVDKLIYDLTHTPNSRRMMVTMWNVEDLKDMNLEPCAYSMTFNVTGDKLNAILNQRSQDMLTAGNWNVVQYSILLMLIARHVGLKAGKLLHVISDCHIYDRHIPLVKEMMSVYYNVIPQAGNDLKIGTDVRIESDNTDFYKAQVSDIIIDEYTPDTFNHKIPVAI